MKLVAEILTGSLVYVEVGEDATVGDLKKVIGNQENLPRDRLILMLDADDERYLLDKDEVSLKDYGVQDSSHIYIFFEPLLDYGSPTSPPTPKESASVEPSPSMDFTNEPPNEANENEPENKANEDEPSNEANEDEPSNEANKPSSSVDPRTDQPEE